jgi:hypothetical protein
MRAICKGADTINYTLALLAGCACEMLASARGDRQHPEKVLEEVLDDEWKPLAGCLFGALRNGLAHSFDTKHVVIDGQAHQIFMQWYSNRSFWLGRSDGSIGIFMSARVLAEALCAKIDELEQALQLDAHARELWHNKAHRYQRDAPLNRHEKLAWDKLVRAQSR